MKCRDFRLREIEFGLEFYLYLSFLGGSGEGVELKNKNRFLWYVFVQNKSIFFLLIKVDLSK